MAYSGLYALDLGVDTEDQIWVVGQDLRMFDGSEWTYYNYTNSAVPSAYPFFLDTRAISIAPDNKKWVGCGMNSSFDDIAVFYLDGDDPTRGKSWSFDDIDTFGLPMEVSKIYACPFGNAVLAFLNPLNTSDVTHSGSYSTVTYWKEIGSGLTGSSAKFISFFDDSEGYFGGPYEDSTDDAIYYTSDGGENWEVSGNGYNIGGQIVAGSVGFSSNGVVVYLASSLAAYKYLVSSNSWTPGLSLLPSSTSTPVDVAFCFSDTTVLVLYEDGNVDKSTNGGVNFSAQSPISGSNFTRISGAFGSLRVFAAGASPSYSGAIFLSINTGNSFQSTPVYTGDSPIYDVHVNPANVNRVYAVGATGTILRSTVAGAGGTWFQSTTVPTTENLRSIRFSPTDQNVGWVVGDNGTLLKTVDGGVTWDHDPIIGGPLSYNINVLDIQSNISGFGAGDNDQIISMVSHNGPTGGNQFLYRYDVPNDEWKQVAEDYSWPFIYDIIARGFGGNSYRYYLGTDQGVIEIPGEELDVQTLENGTPYVPAANFFNSKNFSNLGDNVYSFDLDENFNLWAGSDGGKIQFWDFEKWDVFQTPGATAPVTALKTRRNGHVFWGDYQFANGIYHFNGATASLTSLSGGNEVLSIGLQNRNRNQNGVLTYEDDLWILTNNDLQRLSYEVPYIKASSKYEGATGWNFTYYTQATGASRPYPTAIAHSDKYSWEYPDWLTYDSDYVQYKFPGLDPRNMFLTTKLSDIASGKAGKQDYWNSSPVPDYSDLELEDKVQEAKWAQIISNLPSGGGSNLLSFNVYGTGILNTGNKSQYMICGDIRGRFDPFVDESQSGVNLGRDIEGNDFYATPSNPSLFASDTVQGGETYDDSQTASANINAYTGFIASYDEEGRVVGFMRFPGKSTTVYRILPSEDGKSVYAIGKYNGFIEIGDFIWSSSTNTPGPTGAPIGLTNPNVPGLDTDFNWIYEPGGTAENSSNFGISWTYRSSSTTIAAGPNFRLYYEDASTQIPAGTVDGDTNLSYISIAQTTVAGTFTPTSAYTGQTVQIGSIYYRIDSIKLYYSDPRFSSPTFLLGVTYVSGSQVFSSNANYVFNFYNWNQLTFPLLRSNATSLNLEADEGLFIAELSTNLGNTTSFKDLSTHPEVYYQVKNFRHFPSYLSNISGQFEKICVDSSLDDLAIIFEYDYPSSTDQKVSTLANAWRRTTDYTGAPETIDRVSSSSVSDVTGIVVLRATDFSLRCVSNFNSSTSQSIRSPMISTLTGTNGFLVAGSSSVSLNIGGLTLDPPAAYTSSIPFYVIGDFSDPTSLGVTGSFLSDLGTTSTSPLLLPPQVNSGFLAKSDGYYVWGNQFYGGSGGGSYLGETIESSLPYQYIVTGFISPSNSVEKVVYDALPGIKTITQAQVPSVFNTLHQSSSVVTDKNHLIGFFAGATSESSALALQSIYLFKQDLTDGRIELLSWGGVRSHESSYSASPNGDIFALTENSFALGGTTGPSWMGNLTTTTTSNIAVFLSKQYNAPTGINMGQIISRPGSNPWTWCDVHQTERGMEIPLMCTVFFSNYNSALYGKQNNKWILSNAKTGDEILNVKNTPYFIYTFTDLGYYTIYNEVEDAYGNVYEISKSGFITVIDHTIKRPNDENPLVVNSADYGYPIPPKTKQEKINSLEKAMLQDQLEKMKQNAVPFASTLIIKDNPDATFNQ
jgi:photosystem II stability/assembly factor-like uncharacterized protein